MLMLNGSYILKITIIGIFVINNSNSVPTSKDYGDIRLQMLLLQTGSREKERGRSSPGCDIVSSVCSYDHTMGFCSERSNEWNIFA